MTGGFGEVLQHGYTHRQDQPGVLSLFTGRSDELVGLPREEVRRRLGLGRELLRRALGLARDSCLRPGKSVGRRPKRRTDFETTMSPRGLCNGPNAEVSEELCEGGGLVVGGEAAGVGEDPGVAAAEGGFFLAMTTAFYKDGTPPAT